MQYAIAQFYNHHTSNQWNIYNFSPAEMFLETNTFSIFTSSKYIDFFCGQIYFVQFQYYQTLRLLCPFLHMIKNFVL